MRYLRLHGVSLVEIMVVLAVLGIVASVAAPSFNNLMDRRRVQAIAAELSTNLAYARSETGLKPLDLSVRFGGNAAMSCYTIANEAGVGSCNCTRGPGAACSGKFSRFVELKTIQIPRSQGVDVSVDATWASKDTTNVIKFTAPQMTATPGDAVITVKGRSGSLLVRVSAIGRISVCAPDDSMSGVARC